MRIIWCRCVPQRSVYLTKRSMTVELKSSLQTVLELLAKEVMKQSW